MRVDVTPPRFSAGWTLGLLLEARNVGDVDVRGEEMVEVNAAFVNS